MPSSGNDIKLQPRWIYRAAPSSGREAETAQQVWKKQANRLIRRKTLLLIRSVQLKWFSNWYFKVQENLHTVIYVG